MEDDELDDILGKSDNEPVSVSFLSVCESPLRKRKYTPQSLLAKFVDYHNWYTNNPLQAQKAFGTGLKLNENKLRAMTETTFLMYAGISHDTFGKMKSGKTFHPDKPELKTSNERYTQVAKYIENAIYSQKLEGAAAGLLNANIISRELGLVDKIQSTNINLNADIDRETLLKLSNLLDEDI